LSAHGILTIDIRSMIRDGDAGAAQGFRQNGKQTELFQVAEAASAFSSNNPSPPAKSNARRRAELSSPALVHPEDSLCQEVPFILRTESFEFGQPPGWWFRKSKVLARSPRRPAGRGNLAGHELRGILRPPTHIAKKITGLRCVL
jgi:hypothetical protein